ncbi:hypothetical protein CR51_06745 [Caballeronia megalochromosomata]|nr:hypothetical protein CR51_06745 [Caballeronia megalochromosomata]
MTTSIDHSLTAAQFDAPTHRAVFDFATSLLVGAVSSVELISRELSLSPSMLERARHALDCLHCVEVILDEGIAVQVRDPVSRRSAIANELYEFLEKWPYDFLKMQFDQFVAGG